MTQPVTLRSVMDGGTYTVHDDGYSRNDPGLPGNGRRNLQHALEKEAPDGLPLFYPCELKNGKFTYPRLKSWSVNNTVYEPPRIAMDRTWGKREDERLAQFQAAAHAIAEESAQRMRDRHAPRPAELFAAVGAMTVEQRQALREALS